eukprot:CAMPEP_0203797438 /NCGR_PEP_ID=MMETSP0100_2-20121128/8640_1 /ASSEMBLY_ACC=CAM_ASM_000210 /TAXON_ID=96639 /ORGANISM=" , Strain NY0313808BC1" /LENGTH=172 /DNA_ID=CAMNT_0050702767 /DNA_START=15 /DNA_END=530 /DNA_ORIENTATION=+
MERSILLIACLFASVCSTFGFLDAIFRPMIEKEAFVQFQSLDYFTICEVKVYDIHDKRITPTDVTSTRMYGGTKPSYAVDNSTRRHDWRECAHLDKLHRDENNGVGVLSLKFVNEFPAKVVVYSRFTDSDEVLKNRVKNVLVWVSVWDEMEYLGNLNSDFDVKRLSAGDIEW